MDQRQTITDHLTGPLALVVACVWAAGVLAWPSAVEAKVSHDLLWGGGPGSCMSIGQVEEAGLESLDESSDSTADKNQSTPRQRALTEAVSEETSLASTPPCLDLSTDNEKSNNLCFEKAGVPASVVPKLMAKARAVEQTQGIIAIAERLAGGGPEEDNRDFAALQSAPVGELPPMGPNPNRSCTAYHPDNCRSLPPLPPTLTVEASAVPGRVDSPELSVPSGDETNDQSPPERLRVAPADGYHSPPDKPPRLS